MNDPQERQGRKSKAASHGSERPERELGSIGECKYRGSERRGLGEGEVQESKGSEQAGEVGLSSVAVQGGLMEL
jgi:hypothetical protein